MVWREGREGVKTRHERKKHSLITTYKEGGKSAASGMREKSETPDEDASETPRGMIANRLRF
jgi:hypothetical protein